MQRILIGLILLLMIMGCRFESPGGNQKLVVCITFDDNCASVYNNALPIMKQYGFRGTVFTNSGSVGTAQKLTWAQIDTLNRVYAWEIGGHSLSHAHLSSLTPQEADYEVSADFNNLKLHGIVPKSFATPFGECPVSYYPIINRYYKNIRTTVNVSMLSPIDRTFLGSYEVVYTQSADEVINRITQGVSDRENLIIYTFHDIKTTQSYYAYNYSPDSFRDFVLKLHNLGIKVLPLHEAIEYLED